MAPKKRKVLNKNDVERNDSRAMLKAAIIRNSSKILQDSTNDLASSLNSSNEGTAKKKGRALAGWKKFQAEETPRQILRGFMAAHEESAVNVSTLFPTNNPSDASYLGKVTRTSARINASAVISDAEQEHGISELSSNNESAELSSSLVNRNKRKRRGVASLATPRVTQDEMDLDRDLSRPTDRSFGDTLHQMTDESTDQSTIYRPRTRGKNNPKRVRQEDFELSLALPGPSSHQTTSNTLVEGLGLDTTEESVGHQQKKRDNRKRRAAARKVGVADFTGIELASSRIEHEEVQEGEIGSNVEKVGESFVEAEKTSVDSFSHNESSLLQLKARREKKKTKAAARKVNIADFTGIDLKKSVEEDKEGQETGSKETVEENLSGRVFGADRTSVYSFTDAEVTQTSMLKDRKKKTAARKVDVADFTSIVVVEKLKEKINDVERENPSVSLPVTDESVEINVASPRVEGQEGREKTTNKDNRSVSLIGKETPSSSSEVEDTLGDTFIGAEVLGKRASVKERKTKRKLKTARRKVEMADFTGIAVASSIMEQDGVQDSIEDNNPAINGVEEVDTLIEISSKRARLKRKTKTAARKVDVADTGVDVGSPVVEKLKEKINDVERENLSVSLPEKDHPVGSVNESEDLLVESFSDVSSVREKQTKRKLKTAGRKVEIADFTGIDVVSSVIEPDGVQDSIEGENHTTLSENNKEKSQQWSSNSSQEPKNLHSKSAGPLGKVSLTNSQDSMVTADTTIKTPSPLTKKSKTKVVVDAADFSISLSDSTLKVQQGEEQQDGSFSEEERDGHLVSSKAMRAARKSEVLGHLVRAPCLSNIVETTEVLSRPTSGMETRGSSLGQRFSGQQSGVDGPHAGVGLQSAEGNVQGVTGVVGTQGQGKGQQIESESPLDKKSSPAVPYSTAARPRRSIYQRGLPDSPLLEGSMVLEQTRGFLPEVESTRLASNSTVFASSPETPVPRGCGTKPSTTFAHIPQTTPRLPPIINTPSPSSRTVAAQSRPTNNSPKEDLVSDPVEITTPALPSSPAVRAAATSPLMTKSQSGQSSDPQKQARSEGHQSSHSSSRLSQTQPTGQAPHVSRGKVSRTHHSATLTSQETQYETPEQVLEAKRLRKSTNLAQSLYRTRVELADSAEGGTQTTPTLDMTRASQITVPVLARMSETACQVTPGLEQTTVLTRTNVVEREETQEGDNEETQPLTQVEENMSLSLSQGGDSEGPQMSNIKGIQALPQIRDEDVTRSLLPQSGNIDDTVAEDKKVSKSLNQENLSVEDLSNLTVDQLNKYPKVRSRPKIDVADFTGIEVDRSSVCESIEIATGNRMNSRYGLKESINVESGPYGFEANHVVNSRGNQIQDEETEGFSQKSDNGNKFDGNPSERVVSSELLEFSGIEELEDEVSVAKKCSEAENARNSVSQSKLIVNEHDEANTEVMVSLEAEEEYENDENLPEDQEDGEEAASHRGEPSKTGKRKERSVTNGENNAKQFELEENEELFVPEASQRYLPSTSERKKMRQANLNRYLGIQDKTSQLGLSDMMPPPAPAAKKSVAAVKKAKKTPKVPKTTFTSKVIKFEFNRFSRYKVKKEAECILEDASEDFIDMVMKRLTDVATARGATKIYLCDIRQVMGECGFLKKVEEDPRNQWLYLKLRELVREDLCDELIPRTRGAGRVHPPKDCWMEQGGNKKTAGPNSANKKRKTSSVSSDMPTTSKRSSEGSSEDRTSAGPTSSRTSLGSGSTKAKKIKRFKAVDLEESRGSEGEVGGQASNGKKRKNKVNR